MERDMLDLVAGGHIAAYEPGDDFERIVDFPSRLEITRVQSDSDSPDAPTSLYFGFTLGLVDETLSGTVSGTDDSKLSDLIRAEVGVMATDQQSEEREALDVLRLRAISYGRRRSFKVAMLTAIATALSYRAVESIVEGRANEDGTRNIVGFAVLSLVLTATTFWSAHTAEPSRYATEAQARRHAHVSHRSRLVNAASKILSSKDKVVPGPELTKD